VNCDTQAEIDDYWKKLSNGGQESQCGWLKDKYGLSWQIVPAHIERWLSDKDPEKSARVMAAVLQMTKLDLKTLQAAYDRA
jgi:predicted 3-demethylubiquinone-9 3-methyltransferase (glyoxalase superfamily)